MGDLLDFLFLFFVCCSYAGGKNVKVKIVEEPAVAYKGVNSFYQQQNQITHSIKDLEPRVDPIPFSGPPHLSVLDGKCFHLIENSYKYELCPFHNVTQREQTIRWNAFSGILGVYQGWDIVNKAFASMLMDEGDFCPGNIPRQTKVFFKCGSEQKLVSVSEPLTCRYEMDFRTPLACPLDAMLVYPVLSTAGQSKWESIEESLWREEITKQGYRKRRKQLFISEGLVAAPENKVKREPTHEQSSNEKEKSRKTETKHFKTLEQCSKAFKELHDEVTRLRLLISPFNKQVANVSSNEDNTKTTQTVTTHAPQTIAPKTNTTSHVLGILDSEKLKFQRKHTNVY